MGLQAIYSAYTRDSKTHYRENELKLLVHSPSHDSHMNPQ